MASGDSQVSEPAFEYDELPGPKAFRLVRIVDSLVENMISLVIATFQMSEVTEYIATSYTCGQPYRDIDNPEAAEIPPVRNHVVLLNDRPILIYKNLYDFLTFLDKNNRPGPLWIDALCIAQDNEVEKAAQIMLMEEIYTAAEMVMVWLGPYHQLASDLKWALVRFLPAFCKAIGFHDLSTNGGLREQYIPDDFVAKLHGFRPACTLVPSDPTFVKLLGLNGEAAFEERMFRCLRFYLSCRYFDRAWTFQEIALAKPGHVIFMCSDFFFASHIFKLAWIIKEYGWYDGGRAAFELGLNMEAISRPFDVISRWAYASIMSEEIAHSSMDMEFLAIAGRWQMTDPSPGWMIYLLNISRGLQCTYKRDKLYSLLGMCNRLPYFPIQTFISTDPDTSWQESYTRVTAAILMRGESLDPLDMVEGRKEPMLLDGLPSWVPNYLCGQDHTTFVALPLNTVPTERLFNASRWPKDGDPSFRISLNTIIASAAMIDTVVSVCAIQLGDKSNGIKNLVHFLKDVRSTNAEFDLHVVWKTLTAAECRDVPVEETGNTDLLYAESFRRLCITLCMWFLLPQTVMLQPYHDAFAMKLSDEQRRVELNEVLEIVKNSVLHRNKWTLEEVEARAKYVTDRIGGARQADTDEARKIRVAAAYESDKPMQLFLERSRNSIKGRCLCITSQGRLVLAPLYATVGDQVFVIHRSRSLQVLRPTSTKNEFNYIGAAYIEGCMRGELMRGPNSLEKNFDEIRIV